MSTADASASARVRESLQHPVVDVDGHLVEAFPLFEDYLREVGGADVVRRYHASAGWGGHTNMRRWDAMTDAERRHERLPVMSWWSQPTDALERATSFIPRLFYERLDEFGIDFAIVYPSFGAMLPGFADEELRRAGCRALNIYLMDATSEFSDRMTVPAVIPMDTPNEAIEELEFAVETLGCRCAMVQRYVRRPVPALAGATVPLGPRGSWLDLLAMDSEYDYDPVWAKCRELGVAVTTHSGSMGIGFRDSISSYTYNHIGQFAAAGEAIAKALFLGGVTARFPDVRFAFLEGGVAFGLSLLVALAEHWEKRGRPAIGDLDPARIDRAALGALLDRHGGEPFEREDARRFVLEPDPAHPAELDDFAACRIEKFEDICERFVPSFFFGCEADDPLVATAFDTRLNPFGARLRAMLGSDIGHWDVQQMNAVLFKAHRLVERELLTPDDFRDFAFANAVRLHGEMNPHFFDGTVVEDTAREVLKTTELTEADDRGSESG